ncbi:MAG: hypothetical protein EOO85_02725 [Pedobacter sp.]|nr:MAG: hypothetical protein EOO85_02725 [Pedobacter sp.]
MNLEQAKEEYAKECGYSSWQDLYNNRVGHFSHHIIGFGVFLANAKLDEAAENATCIDVAMTALPEYEVDRQSILSLKLIES